MSEMLAGSFMRATATVLDHFLASGASQKLAEGGARIDSAHRKARIAVPSTV